MAVSSWSGSFALLSWTFTVSLEFYVRVWFNLHLFGIRGTWLDFRFNLPLFGCYAELLPAYSFPPGIVRRSAALQCGPSLLPMDACGNQSQGPLSACADLQSSWHKVEVGIQAAWLHRLWPSLCFAPLLWMASTDSQLRVTELPCSLI